MQLASGSNSPSFQLDDPLSNIVGNLSYVDHFELIICNDIASEDRTWDFSPAKRIWDHFESFPSRLVPGEGSIFAAASKPSVQTVKIRVVLQVVRTRNRDSVCETVELTRQWKIRRLPLASTVVEEVNNAPPAQRTTSNQRGTKPKRVKGPCSPITKTIRQFQGVSIEPIAFEKDMWKDTRWNSSTWQFQEELASFFAQENPELDQFVDIQYVFGGDLHAYFRVQNERRAAGIQPSAG